LPLASFNSDIGFVFACTATGWACFGIWVGNCSLTKEVAH
jgi:hypothetical protein